MPRVTADDPPTVRLPVAYPPVTHRSPADTPAPMRHLSASSVAASDTDLEPAESPLPAVGATVQGFTLVEELGRGAFARVFLAQQDSLANRRVVLKVTRRPTREAEKLARLQHAHVVPVYSVHMHGRVQLICMPLLGRRTIADALRGFHRDHPSRAPSDRRTWATRKLGTTALGSSRAGSSAGLPSGVFARQPAAAAPDVAGPPLVGDVPAVLRTLAALAAGLGHAHARGILHLDIKPANVLLADTGEPMLLDFNLSHDTADADRDMVGGTVQYMSPEQLVDVKSGGRGDVDARSDLYSLGVLAYEMLTAAVPFPAPSQRMTDFDALMTARRRPLRPAGESNPAVTPAVEAIVRKLLAPEPKDRYQTADDLRTDLERQLANRPLKFARDPSVVERVKKWRRRNPWVLARFAAAALIGLAIGSAVAADRQAAARAEGEAVARAQSTRAVLPTLRLDLLLPDDDKARTRGKEYAAELLRGYGLPDDSDWRRKPAFARIPAGEQPAVAGDLGEVLLLLGRARWQDAKGMPEAERKAAAADALKLTRAARDCFPADAAPPMLGRQERELAPAAGEPAAGPEPGDAATPRNRFLDAVELVAAWRYGAAAVLLEQVVATEPNHAAAQFHLAFCRFRLGQHARAAERFEVARVLLPTDPRPCYYRGLVLGFDRKHALAEDDFTRALELDPTHAGAYRDRALTRLARNKPQEAERDLTAALVNGASPFQVRVLRAHTRTVLGDKAGAEADRAANRDEKPSRSADYLVRGWTRIETDPRAALADFRAAAELNPRSLDAQEKQALVLADKLNDPTAALAVYTRLADLYPEYARAHAGRALMLARLGRREEAHRCADQAQMTANDPTLTYYRACVYARTSDGVAAESAKADRGRAVALLRAAFRDGYRNVQQFETDRDLDPLRTVPEFVDFLRAAKELAR